jgi:hypothetical protein
MPAVPTPVAAALGLVPAVFEGVCRLPGRALRLPVLAVGSTLSGLDAARREYDDLALRGERLVARLRGTSFDEVEDRVEDALQGTPLARPYDVVEDALEDAGEAITGTVSSLASRAARRSATVADAAERTASTAADAAERTASTAADAAQRTASEAADRTEEVVGTVADRAEHSVGEAAEKTDQAVGKAAEKTDQVADKAARVAGRAGAPKATGKAGKSATGGQGTAAGKTAATTGRGAARAAGAGQDLAADVQAELPAAEQPKGEPTPSATQPDSTRIDSAASSDVVDTVERVSARSSAPAVVEHDDLPLPDYDHMTLGSLRGRLRSLDVEQLVQVRDYEKAHANRLPVVTMLDNRIAKLAVTPDAAQPSGRPSDRPAPGQRRSRSASKVSPATGGPALNPPSQGVPTNPAQPRTAGSPGTNPHSEA